MMELDVFKLECDGKPFDGQTSFLRWKRFIQLAFDVRCLSDLLREIEPQPESSMTRERRRQEDTACAIIRLSLAPKLRSRVWSETSAKVMMEKLESDYKANSALHSEVYWKKLHALKMEEGANVHLHIAKLHCLVTELEFLGEKNLDEDEQVRLLLRSFPPSFEPLKKILPTVVSGKLTIDRVRDGMLAMECELQIQRWRENKPDPTGEPSSNSDKTHIGYGFESLEDPIYEPVCCQWRSQIDSLLTLRGFYDILQGKDQKPESMTEDEWRRLDAGARLIILNMTPKHRLHVCDEGSAKAMLDKIEEQYKSCKWGQLLRMRLFNLRMKEGSNVHDYIGEFQWLVNELTFLDMMDCGEKLLAGLLLVSLPHSFDPLKERLPEDGQELTMDYVRNSIIGEDMRMKMKRNSRNANQSSKKRQLRHRDKSQIECFRCHRKGHYRNECGRYPY